MLFSLIESQLFEQVGRQVATEEPNKGLKTFQVSKDQYHQREN